MPGYGTVAARVTSCGVNQGRDYSAMQRASAIQVSWADREGDRCLAIAPLKEAITKELPESAGRIGWEGGSGGVLCHGLERSRTLPRKSTAGRLPRLGNMPVCPGRQRRGLGATHAFA